jgi:hypothetical protein
VGRRVVFIPRQSSGWPVHAPCLMQGPPFPDAGLPSDILLLYKIVIIISIIYLNTKFKFKFFILILYIIR